MTDTIEVEAQGSLYDAGARTHRSEGDVFEVRADVVGKHGGLLEPVEGGGGDDDSDEAPAGDESESPPTWWWIGGDGESFDPDGWLSEDYTERAEAVESGDLDHYLDEVAEAETSENVMDAVGSRRETLAESED